ncbi:MAG: PKD domain-containing protein [Bacteroidia bacterium]|nr:PKD domain-containing protein [Bacteroidia bacterium]
MQKSYSQITGRKNVYTAYYSFNAVFQRRLSYAQLPTANFTASPISGCSPLVVNFQDLSTGSPNAWSWSFGNGSTSTLQNPTTTYFTPGTYTVRLTVTNVNGSNTLTRTGYITVFEPPSVNFQLLILQDVFRCVHNSPTCLLRVQAIQMSSGSGALVTGPLHL